MPGLPLVPGLACDTLCVLLFESLKCPDRVLLVSGALVRGRSSGKTAVASCSRIPEGSAATCSAQPPRVL